MKTSHPLRLGGETAGGFTAAGTRAELSLGGGEGAAGTSAGASSMIILQSGSKLSRRDEIFKSEEDTFFKESSSWAILP